MTKFLTLIVVTCLLGSISSIASASLPFEEGLVTKLQIHNAPGNGTEGFIVTLSDKIQLDDNTENTNLCGSGRWTGYLETKGDQAQYSAILAATLANKPLLIEGTVDNCLGSEQIIRNVYIKD